MFRVRHKVSGQMHTVYAANGVRFLLWMETPDDAHWEWVDMAEFEPVKDSK